MMRIFMVLACVLGTTAGAVRADVVVRDDGHRFEGEIVAEDSSAVSIDTVIATVRTTLTLKRSEVKSVEKQPVPPGFFDPPSPPARLSDPKTFGAQDTLYLEVPIAGKFGEAVYADGVGRAIAYAKRNRIKHVVFSINSSGWNNLDEARETAKALKQSHDGLAYHSIVLNCIGDALAVALMCDTVNLAPGAKVGGAPGNLTEATKKQEAEDEQVFRRQLADIVAGHLRERGRPGTIVPAMIDPAAPLAAWLDPKGQIASGAEPPEDLPADHLVFKKAKEEILVLTYDQLRKLGMPAFEGGVGELGKALNLPHWRSESDYGRRAMAEAVAQQKKAARFDTAVRTNVSRREAAEQAIKFNMEVSARYTPTKPESDDSSGSSITIGRRWGGIELSGDSGVYTADSLRRWQSMTDASVAYLQRAAQAALAMKRLDDEARKLGIEPTYEPGELDQLINDLQNKYHTLQTERNTQGN